MKKLSKKVAVITGASRGIGRAISLLFSENGCNLILISRDDEKALMEVESDCKKFDISTLVLSGDIADVKFCEHAAICSVEKFGKIDILVNCAGVIARTSFDEMEYSDWEGVIGINLNGTMQMIKEFLPYLDHNETYNKKIITITSQMAYLPHPGANPSYEVSKSGLLALSRHLAYKNAKKNININCIAPGSINTDMPKSMPEEIRERLIQSIPMKRLGEPIEVAKLALFLASHDSDYITGTTCHINGGSLMI